MAEGYEWVFLLSYASVGSVGLMLLYEAYTMLTERRSRGSTGQPWRRPRPLRRVKMHARIGESGNGRDAGRRLGR